MANIKLRDVFTRMVEDVEHTSVGHPSCGPPAGGTQAGAARSDRERLGPQGGGVGGVVGFLEEVALRWGLAERTRQPDQLPPPLPGPGRAPALRIPSAHAQQDPPGPRGARPDLLRLADAQTLWAVGSLPSRLGLETPSTRNSPPTPPPRRHQGTARSPTCLLAFAMLA
uniref:Uncharacterized protein n=1 Tax=Rangifer tarandus platyrhynchus TaxID=3082113 RepID=A0ACB0DX17_RANTA|nr:unnamed protein product [Rangifer tarandus platyrhynchus]